MLLKSAKTIEQISLVTKTFKMAELTHVQASEKMQNIVEGSENVSLKFGVLIGLIKVESVSNKEVVNTILHLVSTFNDPVYLFRQLLRPGMNFSLHIFATTK